MVVVYMDFNEYQFRAKQTAVYPFRYGTAGLYYTGMGLASEAGEVVGKIKKIMRDDNGYISEARKKEIVDEIGDVIWYCAMICDELQVNLGYAAGKNLQKLEDRKERGMIKGSGDDR